MLSRFSHVRPYVTLWTAACQASLSMGFSWQECWSGLLCPLPGDLPNAGIDRMSIMSPAFADGFFTTSRATWEALFEKCVCVLSCFSHIRLFATLWTVAHQASLSMGFSRQEYWSGLLCPLPGDLLDTGIELGFPTLHVDSLLSKPLGRPQTSSYKINKH